MDEPTPEAKQEEVDDEEIDLIAELFDPSLDVPKPEKSDGEDDDPGYDDVLATPIIHVFSVVVDTTFDNNNDRTCEIYGSIRVMEGLDTSFLLYDRAAEDSDTFIKHGTLTLIGPDDKVILPFTGVTLDLCLKDRIRGVKVIKGNVDFDCLIGDGGDCFDKLMKAVIKGEHGCAYVHYVVFRYAIYCTLEVVITKLRGNQNGNRSDIHGTIAASYGNRRRYCSSDDELKYLESILFNKPGDTPLHVMVGKPIQLSRCLVVVPAYSSLRVEAKLWDSSGMIVDDYSVFQAQCGDKTMFIESQYVCLQVTVKWRNAYLQLYNHPIVLEPTKVVEHEVEEMQKKRRVIHDQPFPSASSASRRHISSIFVKGIEYRGNMLTEVFSVCVGGINTKKIYALCGKIKVQDGNTEYPIYKNNEDCYELLSDDGFASTGGPGQVIANCEFFLSLNLKDPVQKLEVSKGYFCWFTHHHSMNLMCWLDKRLCSVVRGKDGYAAVHYMIFRNAFKAHVEVRIFSYSTADVSANVSGHLIAYYRGSDYSKSYQKKYYRSRLFYLPESKSTEVMMGSKIKLSRSVVAVPLYSSLNIEVDLGAILSTNVGDNKKEYVLETVEFNIDFSCTRKTIRGLNYWIELSVRYEE